MDDQGDPKLGDRPSLERLLERLCVRWSDAKGDAIVYD